MQSLDFGSGTM